MSILYFFNSNKRKNKNEQKEGFLKSMRDENCKRAAAASRRSVSLRQSPAVPFAFPMLRCTAPKEWTLHCTATTSPPWPLCCLLYCSVLACLRRDYPCGGEEKRREETSHVSGFNLWELLLSLSYIDVSSVWMMKSSDVTLFQLVFQARFILSCIISGRRSVGNI